MKHKILCDRCKKEFHIDEEEFEKKVRNNREIICPDCEGDRDI